MKFIALFVSALFLFMKQALGEDFRNFFIIGGSPAPRGRYEYAANLYYSSGSSTPLCGGTLIAKNIVLTAAHCAGAVQVGVGCYDVGANENCDRINVVREILHPSYTGSVTGGFDISILVLAQDSRFEPIALVADENYANQFSSGFPLTVMGWGRTIEGVPSSASDILLEVEVDYTLQSSCDSAYSGRITSSMMCAASPGKDACQGDSGGPLIAKCDATGNDVLVGVVSWGFGCASPSYPGVYARVSTAWPWIESQLNALGVLGEITAPVPSLSNFCSAGPVPTPRPTPSPTPQPIDSSGCADTVPSGLVYSNGQPAECADLGGFACFYYPIVRERCPKTCGTCSTTSRIAGDVETVELEDLVTPEEARKANIGVAAGAVAGCAVFAIAFATTYTRMTKRTVSSSVI